MMARRKPSVRLKKSKGFISIITTFYDDVGKTVKKSVENIKIK